MPKHLSLGPIPTTSATRRELEVAPISFFIEVHIVQTLAPEHPTEDHLEALRDVLGTGPQVVPWLAKRHELSVGLCLGRSLVAGIACTSLADLALTICSMRGVDRGKTAKGKLSKGPTTATKMPMVLIPTHSHICQDLINQLPP